VDWRIVAVLALAGACLVSGGAVAGGAPQQGSAQERAAILRVMEDGRRALLAGDGETACRLLTARGRKRSLLYQIDFVPEGTDIPTKRRGVPQTCPEIVRAEWKLEHDPQVDQSWIPGLRRARFAVISVQGRRARVRLKVPGKYEPAFRFTLLRTERGWRIDDSDALPS
jgi:hypothetical protein